MIGQSPPKAIPTLARYGVTAGVLAAALALLLALMAPQGGVLHDLSPHFVAALAGFAGLSVLAAFAGNWIARRTAPAPATDVSSEAAPAVTPDVDDLIGMLDDTLLIAREEEAAGRAQAVDVGELLSALCAGHDETRLTLTGTRSGLNTNAERSAIERVFEILVENALANGRNVALWCDRGTEALVVHVDDDGPGVARADRARIFEWRYYMTVPPSQRTACRAELVVARQIARSRGGDVSVAASPLGGARFTVRLPLHDGSARPLQAVS